MRDSFLLISDFCREIISLISNSSIVFSFSTSESCSSAICRANCSESAFARASCSCAPMDSLVESKSKIKKISALKHDAVPTKILWTPQKNIKLNRWHQSCSVHSSLIQIQLVSLRGLFSLGLILGFWCLLLLCAFYCAICFCSGLFLVRQVISPLAHFFHLWSLLSLLFILVFYFMVHSSFVCKYNLFLIYG